MSEHTQRADAQGQTAIRPFRAEIPQADLDDLAARLAATRWADELPPDPDEPPGFTPPGWAYGVPLAYLRRLVGYWRDGFDWRLAVEARLNAYPQFTTTIDGQRIHFLHVRSAEPGAFPLILTHGWPNSVLEYLGLIGPLTDPAAHGADPGDAFDLVIPSVPGFGFSGPTRERGWNRYRTAAAWTDLMRRLGYGRYGAHGNDLGAYVAPEVGRLDPDRVAGVHVTQLYSFPSGDPAELAGITEAEAGNLRFLQAFNDEMSGYARLQQTKPQNVAHALADSPAGQLAWSAHLLAATPDEHVVANAALYWLTNTAASAARFYYEDKHATAVPAGPTTVPTGLASFAYDFRPLRRLAERDHANIVSWNEYQTGSHWATQDAPGPLAGDIRGFFRKLRT
jgi:pimeloyl-ACP methyl ester carboxylesterase